MKRSETQPCPSEFQPRTFDIVEVSPLVAVLSMFPSMFERSQP